MQNLVILRFFSLQIYDSKGADGLIMTFFRAHNAFAYRISIGVLYSIGKRYISQNQFGRKISPSQKLKTDDFEMN